MNFAFKGYQISALQLKGWLKSKTSFQEYKNEIQNSYETRAWIIRCMFSIQCEEFRINHLTLFLIVTMPYACWLLWHAYYIEGLQVTSSFSHSIIQIHNNIMWDWQYTTKYSIYSYWLWEKFHMTLSFPHNTIMNLNDVMQFRITFLKRLFWERYILKGIEDFNLERLVDLEALGLGPKR